MPLKKCFSKCFFRDLKDLALIDNPLTSIPKAINGVKNLLTLDLSSSPIVDIKTNEIAEDHLLQELFLFGMKNLTTVGDCAFCGLLNLKVVHIWWCKKLVSISENAFGGVTEKIMPPIKTFSLEYTNVSTLPEKLLNWNGIQEMQFKNNPFICDCKMAWLINDISMHKFDYIPKYVYFNIFLR